MVAIDHVKILVVDLVKSIALEIRTTVQLAFVFEKLVIKGLHCRECVLNIIEINVLNAAV